MGVYFNDRTALGRTLASNLLQYKGRDAVIVCIKESSLLTALSAAMELRAWVYPLVYESIYTTDGSHRILGAFDEAGNFVAGDLSITSEDIVTAESQKSLALAAIKDRMVRYEMTLEKQAMNNRPVIIMGDIVTNTLPLIVTSHLLDDIRPSGLSIAVGNATVETAAMIQTIAEKPIILDVISGVVQNDEHYFEHTDAYSSDQKHTLTQHIRTYWH